MTIRLDNDEFDPAVDNAAWLRAHADGIICFGGVDWWYHNRGHYDLQMMRELSATVPVLYVNSIGMRVPNPREGRRFVSRVSRKLRSLRRGLHQAEDNLWVLSPPTLPGPSGARFTRSMLVRSVRAGARRAGITRPLVWVACPPAAPAIGALAPAAVVYQRTDRYECYQGVDSEAVRTLDVRLKTRADLTVFCANTLFDQERDACRAACLVEHGVDERFFRADEVRDEPEDLRTIPGPRVGFVGGIDAHTFDLDLFATVARQLHDVQFVLVGECSLPADWCELPNVHHLGRRSFADVPRYLAACDALIMPWNRSPWIEGCNPVKLREYLASGRPVVSTDFPELQHYHDVVQVANGDDAFGAAIRRALDKPGDAETRRARVRGATWADRADAVLGALAASVSETAPGTARTRPTAIAPRPALRLAPGTTARPARVEGIDIAAFVILAGGLRPSPLVEATQHSVLDLWLTTEDTVLDTWVARCHEAGPSPGAPVRVIHDSTLPPPWPRRGDPDVTVEREPRALRGTAGLLRDVAVEYGANRHVIVCQGAHYLDGSLDPIVKTHVRSGAAITIAVNPDNSPAGIYIVRCDTLRSIPTLGFVDLKEQWLRRAIDTGTHVQVHRLESRGTMPLRTREQFLAAARVANGDRDIRVICPGGLVAPGAVVTESIVMPGAMVQRNAIVTRSILCPDARAEPGEVITAATLRAGGICERSRVRTPFLHDPLSSIPTPGPRPDAALLLRTHFERGQS